MQNLENSSLTSGQMKEEELPPQPVSMTKYIDLICLLIESCDGYYVLHRASATGTQVLMQVTCYTTLSLFGRHTTALEDSLPSYAPEMSLPVYISRNKTNY